MTDCLFCRIAQGDAPVSLVHQDRLCVAFMDLYPLRPGHVLIVPREHAVFLHELSTEVQLHLFRLGCRVLKAQQRAGIPWEGAQVLVNDGPAAGQHVAHVHLHLIPRTHGDRFQVMAGFVGRVLNVFGRAHQRTQLDALAARIHAELEKTP